MVSFQEPHMNEIERKSMNKSKLSFYAAGILC